MMAVINFLDPKERQKCMKPGEICLFWVCRWPKRFYDQFLYTFFWLWSLRLSGKRELVQLNPFDLVVLLTLSNTARNAIIGEDHRVSGGITGATSLLAVNYLVVRFLYGHNRIDQLVEGSADVLIENGAVRLGRLKNEQIRIGSRHA
jgi:uncharacterized membrane protein YcaP (DUF421 family)